MSQAAAVRAPSALFSRERCKKQAICPEANGLFPDFKNAGRLFHIESLLEALNASAGVDQLLLACKEGMAVRADFNTQILLGGACFKSVAASAGNCCPLVLGMDSLFHLYLTSHLQQITYKKYNIIFPGKLQGFYTKNTGKNYTQKKIDFFVYIFDNLHVRNTAVKRLL